jgi:hypothetical protein
MHLGHDTCSAVNLSEAQPAFGVGQILIIGIS